MKKEIRNAIGFLLGIPFIWIGYDHFIDPGIYDLIVPSYLGFPRFWTIISGVFEVTLGIGIIIPFFRRYKNALFEIRTKSINNRKHNWDSP